MLFSETTGRKVVSTSTADTVGVVHSLVVDPASRSVVALSLSKTAGPATMLPWSSLTAVGADAVTVPGLSSVVAPDDHLALLSDKHHTLLKKRVLTTQGQEIGTVRDVDFDQATGALQSLLLEQLVVPGAALLGVGSYAVVVQAPSAAPA
ncbi:hypothetical protein GIS00_13055 [Nakamurella sp. YIM 132087]|uniref:PRC-barrel domain-containing protein n=1 Tax=Nakamurella alba TaxID=2665158 RepID=A0A7K1FL84_9ACTN|nr:PRC-barrel domain-containing protein [Nakamurella alba]MTD14868.1 hypothetical protein [Nakamurella alba]